MNRPPASFSYERPPSRAAARDAAQSISSADSGERSVAARWSWAAPGLSSGRFFVAATAIYSVFRRNLEIPHQSAGGVFSRGSVVPYMHRISLGIVGFERKGGEAVEL